VLRIGLTGGIGCGKSTVAELFSRRGVPIIDADAIARQLTAPGGSAIRKIAESLGEDLVQNGMLDRRRLAERVFRHPAKLQRLETILHPQIRAEMLEQLTRVTAPYCLLVIPLLIETSQQDIVDRVLVIDVEEQQQIERVRQRDNRGTEEIRAILAAQVSRARRLAEADDVISNSGSIEDLDKAVEELHRKYLTLAASHPATV